MIQNNMLLPFYELKEQQFRFRNYCNNGEEPHSFRIPNYTLPSFFFKREKRSLDINYFYVYDLNDNLVVAMDGIYLHKVSSADFDGFGYVPNRIENALDVFADAAPGDSEFNNYLLPCGRYYIKLSESDNIKSYYSEVFEVTDAPAITDKEELIVNGTFSGGLTNWLTNGTWSVAAGQAVYAGGGGGYILSQPINTTDDDHHFYKVSFRINVYNDLGDATRYLRVYFNGLDALNSVVVKGNGTYTYYVKNVSQFYIQHLNGEVRFNIDDISCQKVVGHEKHVSLLLARDCKFPNSIDKANYNYFNSYLLDALILAPEYGAVNKQDENGDFEKVFTYVRPFKTHQLSPMLLSEPVADALAQLNTFDITEIYDGIKNDIFRINSIERLTKFRSIQSFDVKIEWQQPNDCYMLANISFEENLSGWDKCCDDAQEILPCFDPDAPADEFIQPEIEVTFVDGHFHISLINAPIGMGASYCELLYKKQATADFTDCDGIGSVDTLAAVSVPYSVFADAGIDFYIPDLAGFAYKFAVLFTQVGCPDVFAFSTSACHNPCIYFNAAVTGCYNISVVGGHTVYSVESNLDLSICELGGITIELYNSNTSTWFEPGVSSYPLPEGVSHPQLVFDDTQAALPGHVTMARLRKSGVTYDETTVTLGAC